MTQRPVTEKDLLTYIDESPQPLTKRELAGAFKIKGDDRRPFNSMLKNLEEEGRLVKQPGGAYAVPGALPSVGVIEITDVNLDGDVFAKPVKWNAEEDGPAPHIEVKPGKKGHPPYAKGDRLLARLEKQDAIYAARPIRRLDTPQSRVLGMVVKDGKKYLLRPTDKKAKYDFSIPEKDLNKAKDGDIALGEVQPDKGRRREKDVRIIDVIGHETDPKAISLISAHEMGLRGDFTHEAIKETKDMKVPPVKGREDLRDIPLVTIDGADARDFDDAVYAEKTGDGFAIIVAIADVSYYVRPDTPLDKEALGRGNSTYFPDRVIPMLPEALSNDLCSLRPKEDRACLAARMTIDRDGNLKSYKFVRGLIKSAARLTYEQVQAARDGQSDDVTGPLLDPVIKPLYEAYDILVRARDKRGTLDLDLPERAIEIDGKGRVTAIKRRTRLDSHKLIEEFMILANVAAAAALEKKDAPCVYRVHEAPDPVKLESVRDMVRAFGLSLPRGQVIRGPQLNQLLHKAADMPFGHLISSVILRAQSQAHYSTENYGHFGLALSKYAHFTSPIRRYADLLVHRSLVSAYGLGPGGLDESQRVRLGEMAEHISQTERISMTAERNATDRFTALYLSEQTGAEFNGRISGVTRFGLFVELDETGADGLIPIRTLPDDYYDHIEEQHALIGRRHGRVYRMGAPVTVRLMEADALTGGTILQLVGDMSADIPGFTVKAKSKKGGKTKAGKKKNVKRKGKGKKGKSPRRR